MSDRIRSSFAWRQTISQAASTQSWSFRLLTNWHHFMSAQSKWRWTGFRRAFRLSALSGLQHEVLHVEPVDLLAPAEFGDPLSPWRRSAIYPLLKQLIVGTQKTAQAAVAARSGLPETPVQQEDNVSISPRRNAVPNAATRPERTHEEQTDPPRVALTANPADRPPPILHIRPGCRRPAGKALLWSARFRPPA